MIFLKILWVAFCIFACNILVEVATIPYLIKLEGESVLRFGFVLIGVMYLAMGAIPFTPRLRKM